MSNVFRTILVPEQSASTFNDLAEQLGQGQMFNRKLELSSSRGQASHRIASGVVDDVIDIIFGGGVACQEYLQSKGVTLTLSDISNILSGSVVSDKKPLDLMSDMNLVFTAEPEL